MTTDLFINIGEQLLKVSKISKGLSYSFDSIEDRQTARKFFEDKGIETAYVKDECRKPEHKEERASFRVVVSDNVPLYALHSTDENGFIKAMNMEESQLISNILSEKNISSRIESISTSHYSSASVAESSNKEQKKVIELTSKKREAIGKITKDIEKITRHSMKIQVSEHIQERCEQDSEFALAVTNPKKSLANCFKYINNKAMDWIKEDAKARGEKLSGSFGGDVPDDICFEWAIEYFQKTDLAEDEEKNKPKIVKGEKKEVKQSSVGTKKTGSSRQQKIGESAMEKSEQITSQKNRVSNEESGQISDNQEINYVFAARIHEMETERILAVTFFSIQNRLAEFRVFFNRESFVTEKLNPERKWSEATIENLLAGSGYKNAICADHVTEENILRYFEIADKKNSIEVLKSFQIHIRANRLEAKHNKIRARIDEQMSEIEELPKDFEKWLEEEALPHSRYIYYKRKGKVINGYCTVCKNDVVLIHAKHNEQGQCPNCKKEITCKAEGKSTRIKMQHQSMSDKDIDFYTEMFQPKQRVQAYEGSDYPRIRR